MKSRRFSETALVVCILFAITSFILLLFSFQPQALTKLERRIVDEWAGASGWTFQFAADHTYRSSDGQFSGFSGKWRVENGRLHLQYWQPGPAPASIGDYIELLGAKYHAEHESWVLDLADDNTTMNLSLPGNSVVLNRTAD